MNKNLFCQNQFFFIQSTIAVLSDVKYIIFSLFLLHKYFKDLEILFVLIEKRDKWSFRHNKKENYLLLLSPCDLSHIRKLTYFDWS